MKKIIWRSLFNKYYETEGSFLKILFISFKVADMSIDGFSHLDLRLLACEIGVCVCYTPPVSYTLGSQCSSS